MTDQSGVVVRGLSDELSDLFAEGLEVVRSKRAKNMLLSTYYDSHQALKDLGVSIPPQLSNVGAALGWPSRAVNARRPPDRKSKRLNSSHVSISYAVYC